MRNSLLGLWVKIISTIPPLSFHDSERAPFLGPDVISQAVYSELRAHLWGWFEAVYHQAWNPLFPFLWSLPLAKCSQEHEYKCSEIFALRTHMLRIFNLKFIQERARHQFIMYRSLICLFIKKNLVSKRKNETGLSSPCGMHP